MGTLPLDVVWAHCLWMWCGHIAFGCGVGTLPLDVVCIWMWCGHIALILDVVWAHCIWMWCGHIAFGCGVGTLHLDVVWAHYIKYVRTAYVAMYLQLM